MSCLNQLGRAALGTLTECPEETPPTGLDDITINPYAHDTEEGIELLEDQGSLAGKIASMGKNAVVQAAKEIVKNVTA